MSEIINPAFYITSTPKLVGPKISRNRTPEREETKASEGLTCIQTPVSKHPPTAIPGREVRSACACLVFDVPDTENM